MQTQKQTITHTKAQQIRQLHKYVLAMVSVLILFGITFPLACLRVSQSQKYGGAAFKSLSWEEPQRPVTSYTSLVKDDSHKTKSGK